MITEHACVDAMDLADRLAAGISRCLTEAISQRGAALIAVSGGRSPQVLFDRLAATDLPWHAVSIGLVDERWLPPDHAESNERLVREHLLAGRAAAATLVPMKNGSPDAGGGQARCEAVLSTLAWPCDLMVLGMGEDGHTASLFPGAPELSAALDVQRPEHCIAVHPTHAPHARMSLTLRAILRSRRIVLQIGGPSKVGVYRAALANGPITQMPVRAILRQEQVPVEVWYHTAEG